MSIFGVFLVCIFPYSNWIRKDMEYLSVFSLNVGKYGPEKLRIWTLFTQLLFWRKTWKFYRKIPALGAFFVIVLRPETFNFLKIKTSLKMFSCKISEHFQNTFFKYSWSSCYKSVLSKIWCQNFEDSVKFYFICLQIYSYRDKLRVQSRTGTLRCAKHLLNVGFSGVYNLSRNKERNVYNFLAE